MPTFNVQMFEGRTVEQKRNFVAEVTRVTCETLGCSPGSVDIIITDKGISDADRQALEQHGIQVVLV